MSGGPPKRPASGYIIYSNERRPILKSQHPNMPITELSKLIGAEWKALGEDEKKKYNSSAAEAQIQYKKDVAKWNEEHPGESAAAAAKKTKGKGKRGKKEEGGKKKKQTKDPNAPKRPATAFFLFRTSLLQKHKEEGTKSPDPATMSQMWKAMTADQKQPYESKAEKAKAEWDEAMKQYKAKGSSAAAAAAGGDDDDDEEADAESDENVSSGSDDE